MKKKNGITPPSKKAILFIDDILAMKLTEAAKVADKFSGVNLPYNFDHVPYGACFAFNRSSEIRKIFEPHVLECTYCQKVIERALKKP